LQESLETIQYRLLSELLTADNPEEVILSLKHALTQHESWSGILQLQTHSGQLFWAQVEVIPQSNQGFAIHIEDVTYLITQTLELQEQVSNLEQERESLLIDLQTFENIADEFRQKYLEESRYVQVVNKAICVAELDSQGNILKANQEFIQLSGISAEELTTRKRNFFRDILRLPESTISPFRINGEISKRRMQLYDANGKLRKIEAGIFQDPNSSIGSRWFLIGLEIVSER
ncbi:MAG: PAS domain S-box protein, partial [Bacteroidia bacterium]|nr:PAS domain S-box protein [Bacteroidia bacterium]